MALKLIFTKNSPFNTTLVDEASGAVMYEIETEGKFFSKTTVIRKPFTNRRGEPVPHTSTEVARIQWKSWSSDRVTYYGHEMKRGEFMPKEGFFRRSYVITANGKKYRWSAGQGLPKLVTKDRKEKLVAKLHSAHLVFHRRKAFLEVTPTGLVMLDLIVVSLVYVESKRRERRSQNSAAVAAAGGGGSGS